MIRLTCAEIAAITGGVLLLPRGDDPPQTPPAHGGAPSPPMPPWPPWVTGPVVIDSRKVEPGGLFAALPGERVDGHDFAAAAIAAGAAAVLASRPLTGAPGTPGAPGAPGVPVIVVPDVTAALAALAAAVLRRLPAATVVGITGSSGKTSTKDLTGQVVEHLGPTIAPEGSFNNELGLPLTVLRADETTRYLVLEMSARGPGHIAALCEIAPPKIGAVLNVGRAHAGEFGSLDGVAKAKGELPEALPADGVAILNADDPRVLAMANRTAARIVTFSASGGRPPQPSPHGGTPPPHIPPADIAAADIRLDDLGRASFRLLMPGGIAPVALRLHGAHQVPNALAAAAIAAELGMDTPAIADALSQATARSKRRMELRERPDGVLVINDSYNANPESVRAALEALAHITRDGRRGFAVLGHMAELGDIAKPSHEEAGHLAARAGVTGLIAVGDEARPVIDGARAEPGWHGEALAVPNAETAIAALRNQLRPGDVVLVKASKAVGLWEVADGLLAEVSR
jgi:UDP-N-acetylmuramoyl-tripeptide--D-alanyl-D-alanine ligase